MKIIKRTMVAGLGMALLMVCMMLFPVKADAAEIINSGSCGADVIWTLDDEGTLTISGTGDMDD